MKSRNLAAWRLIVFTVLAITGGFLFSSCAASQNSASQNPPLSVKENPKMDSQLNQLVQADQKGEAAAFAESSGIQLEDKKVRVIIECLPGRLEEAAAAAKAAGAVVESTYNDLLQVLAPINALAGLAEEESIRLIRLPMEALPASGSNTANTVNVIMMQERTL